MNPLKRQGRGVGTGSERGDVRAAAFSKALTPLVCLWGLLASMGEVRGGDLVFDRYTVEVAAELGDKKRGGVFRFSNKGTETIEIREVRTSCGCTTTALDKKVYEPGESGEIEAILNIGQRVGKQQKSVQVLTDEGGKPSRYTLHFVVNIPEGLRIRPRLLYWRVGEPRTPKSIAVEVTQEDPIKITDIIDTSGKFEIDLRRIEEGRRYKIVVVPTTTDEILDGTLEFRTDLPSDSAPKFSAFLRVR